MYNDLSATEYYNPEKPSHKSRKNVVHNRPQKWPLRVNLGSAQYVKNNDSSKHWWQKRFVMFSYTTKRCMSLI